MAPADPKDQRSDVMDGVEVVVAVAAVVAAEQHRRWNDSAAWVGHSGNS